MKTNKKLFLSILALSSINFSVIHADNNSTQPKSTPSKSTPSKSTPSKSAPTKPAPTCFAKNGDDEFDSCASCNKKASWWFSKSDQETCCKYLFDSKRAGNKHIDLLAAYLLLSSVNGPNSVKNNEKEMVNAIMETTGCDYKASKDALHDALHELTKK